MIIIENRCDDDGNSLVTCRSACENLMVACQNQKDLWRCGESEYFNGYDAEEPEIDSNGDPVYLRDYFPGNLQCTTCAAAHRTRSRS